MREQAPTTPSTEAQSNLDVAMRLTYASPHVGDSLATMQEDGIRTTEHRFGQGAQTPDAEIATTTLSGHLAQTKEGDQTYVARIPKSGSELPAGVSVVRPDGKGGEYKASLTGHNAERAAEIVANRASRRVGSAVLKLDAGMRARRRSAMVNSQPH